MVLSWWTSLLALLGLAPKVAETSERISEDVQAKRDLDEADRNAADARRVVDSVNRKNGG